MSKLIYKAKNASLIKIKCAHCGKLITKSNIKQHENACRLNSKNYKECPVCSKPLIKKWNRIFCSHSCSTKHYNAIHWTVENKKRQSKIIKHKVNNGELTVPIYKGDATTYYKITFNTCVVCKTVFYTRGWKNTRKTCCKECRTISTINSRKYKCNIKKTTLFYNPYENKKVLLESSWEVRAANLLCKLDITWIRPKPIKWIDANQTHRLYFPDFYLPDYDIYLDPKNPYCMEQDKEKLSIVCKNIKLIYGDIKMIETYISTLSM